MTLWQPHARRIQFARPATNGRFSIIGLPPGEYTISAVADLAPDDLDDRSFLERFQSTAIRITLADGERKIQDWKLGSRTATAVLAPTFSRVLLKRF